MALTEPLRSINLPIINARAILRQSRSFDESPEPETIEGWRIGMRDGFLRLIRRFEFTDHHQLQSFVVLMMEISDNVEGCAIRPHISRERNAVKVQILLFPDRESVRTATILAQICRYMADNPDQLPGSAVAANAS